MKPNLNTIAYYVCMYVQYIICLGNIQTFECNNDIVYISKECHSSHKLKQSGNVASLTT